MRNHLKTPALVLGLMASVVLGAYVYWSYVDAASPGAGGAAVAASRAQEGEGSPTGSGSPDGDGAEPIDSVFVHRATSKSVSFNSTYLDNRLINGNPDAVLAVTQNWNPGGKGGTYNNHPVGVWYDADAGRWAIFNQDREAMPEGVAFNVSVSEGGPATD